MPNFWYYLVLEFKRYGLKNIIFLVSVSFICSIVLSLASSAADFEDYGRAISIIFALICACMFIGIIMSIDMFCGEYLPIRFDSGMGIPVVFIILSKVIFILVLSVFTSIILLIPYFLNSYEILDIKYLYLYISVFFTIVSMSSVSLLVSIIFRHNMNMAMFFVILVMLCQIIFSGFIFKNIGISSAGTGDNLMFLCKYFISFHAIYLIGSALRFDNPPLKNPSANIDEYFYSDFRFFALHLRYLLIFIIISLGLSIIWLYFAGRRDPSHLK